MRFVANGPAIPDELIEARDRGDVIFFCGAGVSIPAGLPSFYSLTQGILTDLGVPDDALGRRILKRAFEEEDPDLKPPMDQVIGALQREYGIGRIEQSVRKQLRATKYSDLRFHKTLLALSRDPNGKSRLITTNFDRLFEKAQPRIKYHVAPFLPDLTTGRDVEGIVYLHGRLQANQSATTSSNLILGAGDYGRAYLAEGWAVNFLRELFNRYTVVLVGYSADDPPVSYLLRGLKTIDKPRQQRIYAFAAGHAGEDDTRWWDRGVQVITYAQAESDHSALWNTLSAWASRAESPDEWHNKLISRATAVGPTNLAAFERGQITSMVSTAQGAHSFLASSPPPAGEWLCVFDANLRYAKALKPIWPNQDELAFDPLAVYGLDDDPPRQIEKSGPLQQSVGLNLLAPNDGDGREHSVRPLMGHFTNWPDSLPRRLSVFAEWIRVVAHEPITAWWAAGSGGLHPTLRRGIRFALKQTPSQMSPLIKKFWRLVLEIKFSPQNLENEDWYELLSEIRRDGWSGATEKSFTKLVLPYLTVQRPVYLGSHPPLDTEHLRLRDLAFFSVEYRANRVEIPPVSNEVLPAIVAALRNGLIQSANFLEGIEETYVRTVTLHRENLPGQVNLHGANSYFRWFADSFERLCNLDIDLGRREFIQWPNSERYFFDKLKVWALSRRDIVTGAEIVAYMLETPREVFWESNHRREMLWALRAWWEDLSVSDLGKITSRILEGPKRHPAETDPEYLKRTSRRIACWLGWLRLHSCVLPNEVEAEYQELIASIGDWNEDWAAAADHSLDSRSGWVHSNSDPASLSNLPISKIAPAALEVERRPALQFVENNPFSGLVKNYTRLAVLALSYEARAKNFPIELWRTLFADWPDNVPDRPLYLASERLKAVPANLVIEMRYECSRWLHKTFSSMMQNLSIGWTVWDFVFQALTEAGAQGVESGLGETTVEGITQQRSRRTVNHAINGPIGELTAAIIDLMIDSAPTERSGIPAPIKSRFERLLGAPGEGSDHAIILLCERLEWLTWIDPEWTAQHLMSLFRIDGPKAEPAWNGFLGANTLPSIILFSELKTDFLAAFGKVETWIWDNSLSRFLSSYLISAVFSVKRPNTLITYEEARSALRKTDDEGRSTALWLISVDTKNSLTFLEKVWPKERRFQTTKTSESMARAAIESGDAFPKVVRAALPLLVPSGNLASELYGLTNSHNHDDQALYRRFPKETVELLNAMLDTTSTHFPPEIAQILKWVSDHRPRLKNEQAWRNLHNLVRAE